jgi:hypothetical protein
MKLKITGLACSASTVCAGTVFTCGVLIGQKTADLCQSLDEQKAWRLELKDAALSGGF